MMNPEIMLKKNFSVILIILLALLLIVFVIWFFEKRKNELDKKMHQPVAGTIITTNRSS